MIVPICFTFSQSSLQSFLNCQYQFYLRYVVRLDWPSALLDPWNFAEMERQSGIRFHQLVYNHFLDLPDELIRQHAQKDPNPQMTMWFENFIRSSIQDTPGNQYPELAVSAAIAGFNYSAKFDLLVTSHQKIHIFDWKTSKRPPKPEWLRKRLQTKLYPLLARSVYRIDHPGDELPEVLFTYWEASYPDIPIEFRFNRADLDLAEKEVCKLANEITSKSAKEFVKTSRVETCSYCLFRTYCQRPSSSSYNDELEYDLLSAQQDFMEKLEE